MDADLYFLSGEVALAMDSYEEAASYFEQAYGEDATYDMAIRIYAVYLEQDRKPTEPDTWRPRYLVRRKMPRITATEEESTIIWMIMTMLQRN